MNRPESEFFGSSFSKIIEMIEMFTDLQNAEAAATQGKAYKSKYFSGKEETKLVKSLNEIEGWKSGN